MASRKHSNQKIKISHSDRQKKSAPVAQAEEKTQQPNALDGVSTPTRTILIHQLGPQNPIMASSQMLALQRQLGNRVANDWMKVSQQGIDKYDSAEKADLQLQPSAVGQAQMKPSTLLTKIQIASALRWYRRFKALFTPVNIRRIQKAIGVSETGTVTKEMIQAVATWQKNNNLKVNGKAGISSLTVMLPFGLAKEEQSQQHIAGTGKVIAGWAGLKTPEKRGHALVEIVNQRLKSIGVPAINFAIKNTAGYEAMFNRVTWTIEISSSLLTSERLTPEQAANLSNTLIHEARHAEQNFMVYRVLVGAGLTEKQIHKRLVAKNAKAIKAALDKPLDPKSIEGMIAAKWYASGNIIGRTGARSARIRLAVNDGMKVYNRAYAALNNAKETFVNAANTYNKSPTRPNKQAKDAAVKQKIRTHKSFKKILKKMLMLQKRYKTIPEEADAYRQMKATAQDFKNLSR
jgi:hypothetical protein